jgi:hypothetical protein
VDYPMRAYGPNVYELALTRYLAAVGLTLMAFVIAAALFPATLLPATTVTGGLLVGVAGAAGLALAIAGGGLRQNRSALDAGMVLLAGSAAAWLAWSLVEARAAPLIVGAVLLVILTIAIALRRRAIRARFKPRFLSPRQFETMVQIADTMIDGDGREVVSPIDVAIRTDHLLADIRSPVTRDIRRLIVLIEYVLPLLIWRPFPFSSLGSYARRRAIDKVIEAGGLFRDVARTLKTLACVGYYGDPRAMRQVGYRPFDERDRAKGVDQTPATYPDPFEQREATT